MGLISSWYWRVVAMYKKRERIYETLKNLAARPPLRLKTVICRFTMCLLLTGDDGDCRWFRRCIKGKTLSQQGIVPLTSQGHHS